MSKNKDTSSNLSNFFVAWRCSEGDVHIHCRISNYFNHGSSAGSECFLNCLGEISEAKELQQLQWDKSEEEETRHN